MGECIDNKSCVVDYDALSKNTNPIGFEKSFEIGCVNVRKSKIPADLVITVRNITPEGGDPSVKKALLFDPIRVVKSVAGLSTLLDVEYPLDTIISRNYLALNKIIFSGFKMSVNDVKQLDHKLKILRAEINGDLTIENVTLSNSVNSDQYDPKIQQYKGSLRADELTGLLIEVEPEAVVTFTFYFDKILNRY